MRLSLGADALSPFITKELEGATFRIANDVLRSTFIVALMGWKVRESAVHEGTETVHMTPAGFGGVGDGHSWVDHHRRAGKGVIVTPPADWIPLSPLLAGDINAIATDDFRNVRRMVASARGFVLAEPAEGWERVSDVAAGAPLPPTTEDNLSAPTMLALAVGLGLALWIWWR